MQITPISVHMRKILLWKPMSDTLRVTLDIVALWLLPDMKIKTQICVVV